MKEGDIGMHFKVLQSSDYFSTTPGRMGSERRETVIRHERFLACLDGKGINQSIPCESAPATPKAPPNVALCRVARIKFRRFQSTDVLHVLAKNDLSSTRPYDEKSHEPVRARLGK